MEAKSTTKKNKPGQGRKRKLTISQMDEIMASPLPFKDLAKKYDVSLCVLYRSIKVRNSPHANFIDRDEAAA